MNTGTEGAGIGHNGFLEPRDWAWEVAQSEAHAYIKLIIHTLELLVTEGEQAAFVSDERLARLTSLSVKTIKKYRRDAMDEGWFSFSLGNGRGMVTEYRISIPKRTVMELAAQLDAAAKGYPGRDTFSNEGTEKGTLGVIPFPQKGTLERQPFQERVPQEGTLLEPKGYPGKDTFSGASENVPPHPPKDNIYLNNIPPIGPPTAEPTVTKRNGRGGKTRLANDWTLPLDWRADTKKVFGATDEQIDVVERGFHRYWTGPDAIRPMKADWKRTWENWFDRQMQRGIRLPNGNGANGQRQLSYAEEEIARRREFMKALES